MDVLMNVGDIGITSLVLESILAQGLPLLLKIFVLEIGPFVESTLDQVDTLSAFWSARLLLLNCIKNVTDFVIVEVSAMATRSILACQFLGLFCQRGLFGILLGQDLLLVGAILFAEGLQTAAGTGMDMCLGGKLGTEGAACDWAFAASICFREAKALCIGHWKPKLDNCKS